MDISFLKRSLSYRNALNHGSAGVKWLLAVGLVIGILGGFFWPTEARAQEYDPDIIDLVLGGEGATSWSIEDIKPCFTGTKTVTLHNAGSANGTVIIWLR